MLSKFLRGALVTSILAGSGVHIAILQSCAWASMAIQRLQTETPAQAISDVFDGEHPCGMCLKVRSTAQPNASTLAAPAAAKLDLLHVQTVAGFRSSGPLWTIEPERDSGLDVLSVVATPPPRSLQA